MIIKQSEVITDAKPVHPPTPIPANIGKVDVQLSTCRQIGIKQLFIGGLFPLAPHKIILTVFV